MEDRSLKLFMFLVGSKAPGRHVEQHDFFFGIGCSVKELIPLVREFWPEAKGKIHIDAWREVRVVDRFTVSVEERPSGRIAADQKLYFLNLGGYQQGKFEEQHYTILTVQPSRADAIRAAKRTAFFKHNGFEKANSHIDDQYGIDVDDVHDVDDILPKSQKDIYRLVLTGNDGMPDDAIHLGYFKLNSF